MANSGKVRICVMVSGGGTNLQALIDSASKGSMPNCEISLVLSNKSDAFALERAKAAGIPAFSFSKKELGMEGFEKAVLAKMAEFEIELVVFAGFLCIVSERFIQAFPERIINIHPSLIPAFCGKGMYGLKVHEAVLARGVKVTGATVHMVNEIPDGGRILLQKTVRVLAGDTPEILQKRVMEQAEWVLLPKAVEKIGKEIRRKGDSYAPVCFGKLSEDR